MERIFPGQFVEDVKLRSEIGLDILLNLFQEGFNTKWLAPSVAKRYFKNNQQVIYPSDERYIVAYSVVYTQMLDKYGQAVDLRTILSDLNFGGGLLIGEKLMDKVLVRTEKDLIEDILMKNARLCA